MPTSILDRFCCQLGSIFQPKIHQNQIKDGFQKPLKISPIFASIFHRFWLHLRTQVGPMSATFSLQDAPKTHQKKNQKVIQTLKTAQNTSQTLQTSIMAPPDLHFGSPGPPSICSTLPLPPPARGSGPAQSVRWTPLSPQRIVFLKEKRSFFKTKLFDADIDVGSILV